MFRVIGNLKEAITLHKERYDQEVSPENRGNEEHIGKLSSNPVPQHHGFRYVSSMPYAQNQKWLLDFGNYYQQENSLSYNNQAITQFKVKGWAVVPKVTQPDGTATT